MADFAYDDDTTDTVSSSESSEMPGSVYLMDSTMSRRVQRIGLWGGFFRLTQKRGWIFARTSLLLIVLVYSWLVIYSDLFGIDYTMGRRDRMRDTPSFWVGLVSVVSGGLLALEGIACWLAGLCVFGRVLVRYPLFVLNMAYGIVVFALQVWEIRTDFNHHLFYAVAIFTSLRILFQGQYEVRSTSFIKAQKLCHKRQVALCDILGVIALMDDTSDEDKAMLGQVAQDIDRHTTSSGGKWSHFEFGRFLNFARARCGNASCLTIVNELAAAKYETLARSYSIVDAVKSSFGYITNANCFKFTLFVLSSIAIGLVAPAQAYLISHITMAVETKDASKATPLLLAYAALFLAGAAGTVAYQFLYSKVVSGTRTAVETRVARKMVHMTAQECYVHPDSSVNATFSADMALMESLFVSTLMQCIGPGFQMILAIAYAISVSPQVGVLAMTVLPFVIVLMPQDMSAKAATMNAAVRTNMIETFQNGVACQRVIWSSDKQAEWLSEYFGPAAKAFQATNSRSLFAGGMVQTFVQQLVNLFLYSHTIVLAWLAVYGVISVSQFTGLLTLFQSLSAPSTTLANSIRSITANQGSAERVDNFLADEFEPEDDEVDVPEDDIERGIKTSDGLECTNLRFTYPGASTPVLDSVSVRIPAGSSVALMGESGCGKSTLLSVAMTWLRPESGVLRLGKEVHMDMNRSGADIDEHARALRERTAVVFQKSSLLSGTVHDNIAFGASSDTSHGDVVWAAKAAGCLDFIMKKLPEGFDTILGKAGSVELSGGQAQRICIARALCRKPSLLLLDEATSALDPETEAQIMDTIYGLRSAYPEDFASLIVLSITHRPETLRYADFIIRMENGTIADFRPTGR